MAILFLIPLKHDYFVNKMFYISDWRRLFATRVFRTRRQNGKPECVQRIVYRSKQVLILKHCIYLSKYKDHLQVRDTLLAVIMVYFKSINAMMCIDFINRPTNKQLTL